MQFDGRYYQVVIANKISWEAAKAAAEQRTFQGVQGHLATIGSPEEDAFVHQLRQQVLSEPHPSLSGTELWVGGYQVPVRHDDAGARMRLDVAERRVDRTDEHRDRLTRTG